MKVSTKRHKYLNLFAIRLPIPGFVSILHRISGVLLFLAIPFLIYLLGISLSSPLDFQRYQAIIDYPLIKLILLGLAWAYLHHFCAGIRFLLLDLHYGIQLPAARHSAKAVLLISLALTALVGVKLW